MTIQFFKNTSDRNRVNKSEYLEFVVSMEGTLRDETSVTAPIINIQYNTIPDFNYCYIVEFKRYYYISNITIINNSMYELELEIDVLMTYKTGIGKLKAFIDRNEFDTNPLIIDKKRPMKIGYDIDIDSNINGSPYRDYSLSRNMFVMTGYKLSVDEEE